MMRSDMHGWPPVCIMRLVYFPLSKTLNHVYFYVLKTWFVILSTYGLLCNVMMYSGPAFVWA
jgi:hypothetical protein